MEDRERQLENLEEKLSEEKHHLRAFQRDLSRRAREQDAERTRLETETIEIQQARTYIGDDEVILVDTPGFDDTERSQADILKLLGEFLQQTWGKSLPVQR